MLYFQITVGFLFKHDLNKENFVLFLSFGKCSTLVFDAFISPDLGDKTVLLFPGQGAQFVGMGQKLLGKINVKIYYNVVFFYLKGHSFVKWNPCFMLDPISRHISKTFHVLNFRIRPLFFLTKYVKCASPIILKCDTVFLFNCVIFFYM